MIRKSHRRKDLYNLNRILTYQKVRVQEMFLPRLQLVVYQDWKKVETACRYFLTRGMKL